MTTPFRKSVRWESQTPVTNENSTSEDLSSGLIESGPSASGIDFINAQLVAHGFVNTPGLHLEGISEEGHDCLIKCLLGLLSQRMEDMSRAEELTGKIRALSYDIERLSSRNDALACDVERAERESQVNKSKVAAADRALQAARAAQKQSMVELQRTRNNILGIRAAHQSELRRKDKDIERMQEKWSKLADVQSKLNSTPSGIHCIRVDCATGANNAQGFLDTALEQAEEAQNRLAEENARLRTLVVKAINGIQSLQHQVASHNQNDYAESVILHTEASLFPLVPSEHAKEKLEHGLSQLGQSIDGFITHQPAGATGSRNVAQDLQSQEVKRLQAKVDNLRKELGNAPISQVDREKYLVAEPAQSSTVPGFSNNQIVMAFQEDAHSYLSDAREVLGFTGPRPTDNDEDINLAWEGTGSENEVIDLKSSAFQAESLKMQRHGPQARSTVKSPARKVGRTSTHRRPSRPKRSLGSSARSTLPFETEVIPLPPQPSQSFLSTTFVLPPPSPQTSLPTRPVLPPSITPLDLIGSSPADHEDHVSVGRTDTDSQRTLFTASSKIPTTPVARPFPVAKPYAQRMIHAYSPVKPSPLNHVILSGADASKSLGEMTDSPDRSGAGSGSTEPFPPMATAGLTMTQTLNSDRRPASSRYTPYTRPTNPGRKPPPPSVKGRSDRLDKGADISEEGITAKPTTGRTSKRTKLNPLSERPSTSASPKPQKHRNPAGSDNSRPRGVGGKTRSGGQSRA